MKKLTLLGNITPAEFLRDYWHKKPLLIRQAIPDFKPLLSRDELFALVKSEDVESRLITHTGKQWEMESGPFEAVPPLTQKNWTLLVQGVNLHDDAADALMRQFSFIPNTRLDDLMISYATETGGVGAHFDSYDVFLLQAHGHRRWRISAQEDLSLVDGVPLKILKNFQPEEEFILAPGDMLYLPPQYAHEGTAMDECMTYSIGFRAPSYQELGEAFLESMIDTIDLPGRYADPDLKPSNQPAEISKTMLTRISSEINKVRFTSEDIALFLGEYLSEPKSNVFFEAPPALSRAKFLQQAKKRGVKLERKSQMLYRDPYIFINGTSFEVESDDLGILAVLANERMISAEKISFASDDVIDALHTWFTDGWLSWLEA
ncbi:cupin domain-containing protein [uncultured Oxalicibacterium sp.]|uniref:cupin domain-containing protein n=1 Tax=uncultured Oxalicibacterium sp. TaxID=1168540 RepID=UPI0025CC1D74|nr:cupin domain-containing protein [uncultured Oxalicibacterium sp.]